MGVLVAIPLFITLLQFHSAYTLDKQSRYEFACNFFYTITSYKPHDNLIISPASAQTCLAMIYLGAEKQTAIEMRHVLALSPTASKEDIAHEYYEFLQATIRAPQSKLEMANRIFVDQRLQILNSYQELISTNFQSTVAQVQFANSQQTAAEINEWVNLETHGKIERVIDASELWSASAIVLINAIYFKAQWKYPFDPRYTIPRDFHLNSWTTVHVPMMYRTNVRMRYGEVYALDLLAAELPYKDSNQRMLIMLPNQLDYGVAQLERIFDVGSLQLVQRSLRDVTMDILIPKFKIEFDLSLVEPLRVMGLNLLFYDADLQSMVTNATRPLYVSEVKHKAYISVDEKGSEASGATYSQLLEKSGRFFEPNLKIDRPFVFAILDDDAIYFAGHVVKP
ncbi:serine protease inhibitor 42Dd-like [Eurosta solidaginis]|uniref:serine protease inhibitor 42Dd-like n=1 Tax=Eurosta solidaginis TaxID=178769 RepID=UPI0035308670